MNDLWAHLGYGECPLTAKELAERNVWLTLDTDGWSESQMAAVLGSGGATLDAIQLLLNAALNAGLAESEHYFVTLEVNGYRQKRIDELQQLATDAVTRVRQLGEDLVLEDLNASDRRQVHLFLQDFPDIATESQGKEPHRHLIVRLVK
ncbi:MAG: RNA-binding protein [Oscillatoriales cyanobacterium SM2_2_1]|nr:RNA-binding protein [Oscillatoriales cyanobacterium SM2_2_1]